MFKMGLKENFALCDPFGSWIVTGGAKAASVTLNVTVGGYTIEKKAEIIRSYYKNRRNDLFKRHMYRIKNSEKVIVAYFIPRGFNYQEFEAGPHGNSQDSDTTYCRTPVEKKEEMRETMQSHQLKPNELRQRMLSEVYLSKTTNIEVVEKLVHIPSLKTIQNTKYDDSSKKQYELLLSEMNKQTQSDRRL